MKLRTVFAIAASLLGITSQAANPENIDLSISWDLSLDSTGAITSLTTKDSQYSKLHDRIASAIRTWRFSTGKVDGIPVATKTTLTVNLQAVPQGNSQYSLHLASAVAGGGYEKIRAPKYPGSAAQLGRQGLVTLRVRYRVDGSVESAEPDGDQGGVDDRLIFAARSSVLHWKFAPEVVGGHPIAAEVFVPVCFHLASKSPPDCHRKDPKTGLDIGNSVVALDPAVKLETDVIGRTL